MDFKIRKYSKSDAQALLALYHDTVHSTNAKDYSDEQINAWVPSSTEGIEVWKERFAHEKTVVAEVGGTVVGFGNLHGETIGMLYVSRDFHGKGAGAALLKRLERKLKKKGVGISSAEVSITARPFFEKQGYRWKSDHRKMFNGQEFLNFIMEKQLGKEKQKMKNKVKEGGSRVSWSELFRHKFFDLLIVIAGVTIAFQLNNLKIESDQRALARFYCESLIADLKEDIADFNFIVSTLESDRNQALAYLKKFKNPEAEPDSLAVLAVNLLTVESFSGNQNTYLTLLNGNGLTSLKERELRRQITEYYSQYAYLDRFEKVQTELILKFYNYISPACDIAGQKITDPSILINVQTKNYLVIFVKHLSTGIEDYGQALKQAETLKKAAEVQLQKF